MATPRRPILWSSDAITYLEGIWYYYARADGLSTADSILRDIGKVVALIEDQPFSGRSKDEVRPGLRSIAFGPHAVFYRVMGGRPEIICMLDARRDIDEMFAHSNT